MKNAKECRIITPQNGTHEFVKNIDLTSNVLYKKYSKMDERKIENLEALKTVWIGTAQAPQHVCL